MAFDELLSVITPVSRPENLSCVALSVPRNAEWILVTDGALTVPDGLRPHLLIEGPRTNQWGDVQRQIGLQAATRPFVYFLDDDNLMLPSLAELVIPFLESQALPGALFGVLVYTPDRETHLWPPPRPVRLGCVDTAMFLGRREAIMQLHFQGTASPGWPNVQGQRYADFIFLQAFENTFQFAHLPAMYGFHNAIPMLQLLEPQFLQDFAANLTSSTALERILSDYLTRADVPPWW